LTESSITRGDTIMASPLLLAGLIGAGGELLSNAPKILGSKYERDQKAKLEELRRKEELGLLGLTEQERSVLEGRLQGRSQQASAAAAAERGRLLAGSMGGATAGTALQEAVLQDEGRARQEVAMQQVIEEQDIAEKQRYLEELAAIEASVAQTAADRKQALFNTFASGAEAVVGASAQGKLIQGSKGPSPQSINILAQRYGLGEDEARGMLELAAENPDLLGYLDRLQGE
jgi:hypothetical protein